MTELRHLFVHSVSTYMQCSLIMQDNLWSLSLNVQIELYFQLFNIFVHFVTFNSLTTFNCEIN